MGREEDQLFYRRQMIKLGNPPMMAWGERALDHWRRHLPELVQHLSDLGVLREAAILAQESATDAYAKMVEDGVDPEAAREIALDQYILLRPSSEEDRPTPQDVELGQQNQLDAFELWLKMQG